MLEDLIPLLEANAKVGGVLLSEVPLVWVLFTLKAKVDELSKKVKEAENAR